MRLVLFVLVGYLASGQDAPRDQRRTEEYISRVRSLVSGVSPSIAAHYLLVYASRSADSLSRRALIEDSIVSSANAPRYQNRYIGSPLHVSAIQGTLDRGVLLDRLTLQLRAIELMSTLDRDHAIRYLEKIVPEVTVRPTCSDDTVPLVRPTYDRIKYVSATLYRRNADDEALYSQYLLRLISATTSSLQLTGVIKLITDAAIGVRVQELLSSAVARTIERLQDGDPSVTVALVDDGLPRQIEAYVDVLVNLQISVEPLVKAYQVYLKHSQIRRCPALLTRERYWFKVPGIDPWERLIALEERLIRAGQLSINARTDRDSVRRLRETTQVYTNEPPRGSLTFQSANGAATIKAVVEFAARAQSARERGDVTTNADTIAYEENNDPLQLTRRCELYIAGLLSQQASPLQILGETAQLFRTLLESVNDERAVSLIAEAYGRSLARIVPIDAELEQQVFQLVRESLLRCWVTSVDRKPPKEDLYSARLNGITAGVQGSPRLLAVVGLIADAESAEECTN